MGTKLTHAAAFSVFCWAPMVNGDSVSVLASFLAFLALSGISKASVEDIAEAVWIEFQTVADRGQPWPLK